MNYFQALGKVKRTDILSVLQRLVYVVLCVTIMGSIRGVTGLTRGSFRRHSRGCRIRLYQRYGFQQLYRQLQNCLS